MGVQDVKLDSDYITILWDDGHEGIYPSRYLRGYCCCAACVEEMTGRRIVGENDVDEYVMALIGYRLVGMRCSFCGVTLMIQAYTLLKCLEIFAGVRSAIANRLSLTVEVS